MTTQLRVLLLFENDKLHISDMQILLLLSLLD